MPFVVWYETLRNLAARTLLRRGNSWDDHDYIFLHCNSLHRFSVSVGETMSILIWVGRIDLMIIAAFALDAVLLFVAVHSILKAGGF